MKHLRNISIVISMLLVTIGNANAGYSWGETETVNRYYPVGGKIVYLRLSSPAHNPAGCGNNYYYVMSSEHPEFEEYRKMILTAMSTGFRLRIGVDKEPGNCSPTYPKIDRMYLTK